MMPIESGKRVSGFKESVTLKLNAQAVKLSEEGNEIFNLTAGQLPFKPDQFLVDKIISECNFLSSFQYAPVTGNNELKEKVLNRFHVDNQSIDSDLGCIISNGAKQSISNILCALINPGDEVIVFTPYWVSYRPLIELFGGVVKEVESDFFDGFQPDLDFLGKVITSNTKAVIVNSPSNPSGVIYSDEWMEGFANLMKKFPQTVIISDEIYRDLYYYDPIPKYFYHFAPELIEQTLIINGVSKSMASTGLRIGWAIGPKGFISTLSKLQGQLTSGANSLVQSALVEYDFKKVSDYLGPVKKHLRENLKVLRDTFKSSGLSHKWYQSRGAFYFILDFNKLPIHNRFANNDSDTKDYGNEICELILKQKGVACVPGGDFGLKNCARISLVSNQNDFIEAINRLVEIIQEEPRSI
jgi:aspartate aminotransferase